jgi:hypothetical protein
MEGPGRKLGGANSNSPKNYNSSSNKLFLKGFHQEHKKLFMKSDTT